MIEDSKALKKVWAWKEKIYTEVKNLPIDKMIKKVLDMAEETGKKWRKTTAKYKKVA